MSSSTSEILRLETKRLPWIVSILAACLYLSIPAAQYNFDAVACAIAVDLGDFKHLVHGNHLIFGLISYVWYAVFRVFGYHGPSLYVLQAMDSILGAAGVGLFAAFLVKSGFRPFFAVAGAAGLMVSKIYWEWSLEVQVYMLAMCFTLMACNELFREDPRLSIAGCWHAGAVLGHVGNVMFVPAALFWLTGSYRSNDERLTAARRYVVPLIAAVIVAYIAAAIAFVRPQSLQEAKVWLLGSAALNVQRTFLWHGGYSSSAFRDWTRLSINLLGGGSWIGVLACAVAAFGAIKHQSRRMVWFSLIWLAAYAVLYVAWEPSTPVYRITDLPPLWLLITMGVIAIPILTSEVKAAILAAAVAGLGVWNAFHSIVPQSDPKHNAALQRVLWIGRNASENAWVAATGLDVVYIPYFTGRKPLILQYYKGRERELEAKVADLSSRGNPVLFVDEGLDPAWAPWLRSRKTTLISSNGQETLYQLVP